MVKRIGMEVIHKQKGYTPKQRTEENNPQAIHNEFKTTIMSEAWKKEWAMTKVTKKTTTSRPAPQSAEWTPR